MPECSGWLVKKGAGILASDQRRWFEFADEGLQYFVGESGGMGRGAAKGTIPMAESTEATPQGDCVLELSGPQLERNYVLTAASTQDRDRWVAAVNEAARAAA
eukprot:gene5963-1124_t